MLTELITIAHKWEELKASEAIDNYCAEHSSKDCDGCPFYNREKSRSLCYLVDDMDISIRHFLKAMNAN
jgi:hypothetical protein